MAGSGSSATPASPGSSSSSPSPTPTPSVAAAPVGAPRRGPTGRASASPASSTRWASAAAHRGARLRRLRVPVGNRIGEEGEGFGLAMRTLERSRPGHRRPGRRDRAGRARGRDALRARAPAVRPADRRVPDDPGMLADMDAPTEAARQLLYTACQEIEAGAPDAARWAAIAKLVGRRHRDAGHHRRGPGPGRLWLHGDTRSSG